MESHARTPCQGAKHPHPHFQVDSSVRVRRLNQAHRCPRASGLTLVRNLPQYPPGFFSLQVSFAAEAISAYSQQHRDALWSRPWPARRAASRSGVIGDRRRPGRVLASSRSIPGCRGHRARYFARGVCARSVGQVGSRRARRTVSAGKRRPGPVWRRRFAPA
jgi:hypothetical protein